jgi:transposase
MKKNSTCPPNRSRQRKAGARPSAIGMDLGDKTSRYCVLDEEGEIVKEDSVGTTKKAMLQVFGSMARCRIAIEVGTHSPWVSRLLKSIGFEVTVANSRSIPLISASTQKSDRRDAQMLARLVRVDPELLRPIQHRGETAQSDLMRIKVGAALLEARTSLVNTARGLTKAAGERLPSCDADAMGRSKRKDCQWNYKQGSDRCCNKWSH